MFAKRYRPRLSRFACLLVFSWLLAGCGGSGGGSSSGNSADNGAGSGMVRDGTVSQQMLASDVDGETIAFTVFEPTAFTEGARYPLILHSHGYGGSRQSTLPAPDSLLRRFLDSGYGVISVDERGHGESGGTIRILDPDFAGQDLLQVLDWAETNLQWLAYDAGATPDTGLGKGNPVIGAVGGSYGGGYQHLIYAIDGKHRLDAIAPDITWNDLRYSLFPGGVFKSFWATALSAAGNVAPNSQDAQVNQGLAEGLTTNSLSQTNLDLLYRNSFASHCAGENDSTAPGGLTPIDALVTQSAQDTLFNFNDAFRNFQCLSAQGGDVRLLTKAVGHGIDNGDGGDQCGPLERADATLAWFEEKLKGKANAAAAIADICLMLDGSGSDFVVVDAVPIGNNNLQPTDIPQQTLLLGAANPIPVSVPVFTNSTEGSALAGIPTVELRVTDPLLGGDGLGDPILFLAIGKRAAGQGQFQPLLNQYRPLRGYGDFSIELNGVFSRLADGDELALMLYPSEATQYASSSSKVPVSVNVSGSIRLPLIAGDPNGQLPDSSIQN